jgi:hypothetical protein
MIIPGNATKRQKLNSSILNIYSMTPNNLQQWKMIYINEYETVLSKYLYSLNSAVVFPKIDFYNEEQKGFVLFCMFYSYLQLKCKKKVRGREQDHTFYPHPLIQNDGYAVPKVYCARFILFIICFWQKEGRYGLWSFPRIDIEQLNGLQASLRHYSMTQKLFNRVTSGIRDFSVFWSNASSAQNGMRYYEKIFGISKDAIDTGFQ